MPEPFEEGEGGVEESSAELSPRRRRKRKTEGVREEGLILLSPTSRATTHSSSPIAPPTGIAANSNLQGLVFGTPQSCRDKLGTILFVIYLSHSPSLDLVIPLLRGQEEGEP